MRPTYGAAAKLAQYSVSSASSISESGPASSPVEEREDISSELESNVFGPPRFLGRGGIGFGIPPYGTISFKHIDKSRPRCPIRIGSRYAKFFHKMLDILENEIDEVVNEKCRELNNLCKYVEDDHFISILIQTFNRPGTPSKLCARISELKAWERKFDFLFPRIIKYIQMTKFLYPNNKRKRTPYAEWPVVSIRDVNTKHNNYKQVCMNGSILSVMQIQLRIFDQQAYRCRNYYFFLGFHEDSRWKLIPQTFYITFIRDIMILIASYKLLNYRLSNTKKIRSEYKYKLFEFIWRSRTLKEFQEIETSSEIEIFSEFTSRRLYYITEGILKSVNIYNSSNKPKNVTHGLYNSKLCKLKEMEGNLFLLYQTLEEEIYKMGIFSLEKGNKFTKGIRGWRLIDLNINSRIPHRMMVEYNIFSSNNLLVVVTQSTSVIFMVVDFECVENYELGRIKLPWTPQNIFPDKCEVLFVNMYKQGALTYNPLALSIIRKGTIVGLRNSDKKDLEESRKYLLSRRRLAQLGDSLSL